MQLLREMLGALSKPWELGTSLLFTHLDTKESDPKMGRLMTESLFRLIEKRMNMRSCGNVKNFRN